MFECSSCHNEFLFEDMCGNARKKITKRLNGIPTSGTALRCKHCEKTDQKTRYYAGLHFGFGANASKNKIWTSLPQDDRWLIAQQFRDILEQSYSGELNNYIKAIKETETPDSIIYDKITPTINDPILRFLKEKHKEITEDFDNRQAKIPEGYVYGVENPAWPRAIKIGSALFYDKRLQNYQTGDPHRSYSLVFTHYVRNRKLAEVKIHQALSTRKISGEWFYKHVDNLAIISDIVDEINMEVSTHLHGGK